MNTKTYTFEGLIKLLRPLSHGGESLRNVFMLRRERIRQPEPVVCSPIVNAALQNAELVVLYVQDAVHKLQEDRKAKRQRRSAAEFYDVDDPVQAAAAIVHAVHASIDWSREHARFDYWDRVCRLTQFAAYAPDLRSFVERLCDKFRVTLANCRDAELRRVVLELLRAPATRAEMRDFAEVFIYSGNAWWGALRDCGMAYFLERLGGNKNLVGEMSEGATIQLDWPIFRLLFSGGMLEEKHRTLDIEYARKLKKLIPLLSVFGGAMGNQIMSGKRRGGRGILICRETKHMIPEKYHTHNINNSFYEMIDVVEYSTMDDSKREHLRKYLRREEEEVAEAPALIDSGGDDVDVPVEASANSYERATQMRYAIEEIAAGAELYMKFELRHVTPIELGAFCSCLAEFSKSPRLGGNLSKDNGLVELHFNRFEVTEQLKLDGELQQARDEYDRSLDEYHRFLADHGVEIKKMLGVKEGR